MGVQGRVYGMAGVAAGVAAVLWLSACSRLVSVCTDGTCGSDDASTRLSDPEGDGRSGERDDAGSTDAGSTDAGNTDAGSTDAGSTDAGSTDAGNADAGNADAGSTDAGDSHDPACELPLKVHHAGEAHVGVPVEVVLPFFAALLPDASNLRFRAADGATLPFWIDEVEATTVYAYVRLPMLAPGDTVVVASTCPMPNETGSDFPRTFPWVALPGPNLEGFTPGCVNFDIPATERCVLTLNAEVSSSAELLAQGSCYGPTYNGSTTFLSTSLPALTGTYRLDKRMEADGRHYDFCSGSTAAKWQLAVGDVVVEGGSCDLVACSSCLVPWSHSSSEPFELNGSPQVLRIETIAGDCAVQVLSFEALRLMPVLDPPPVVTFE